MPTLVLISSAHPFRGGIANFVERLAREFQDTGWKVTIYTFTVQYPGFLFPGKTQYSEEPPPAGLNIKVKVNSMNPLNWFRIGNEISKLRPDLVLYKYWLPFFGPCFGTIARRIRKNGISKQVVIVDNAIPHEKRPGDNAFTKYFFRAVNGFVAMSESVMKDISVFDTKKPRAISPHPLYDNFGEPMNRDEACKSLGLDPAFRYLLFFGFIRAYKGLDILLDAFADERLRKLPLRLIVAGEYYQDPEPYKKQIENLTLASWLVLRNDFIPDSKVKEYFCAADLVVQPYKDATQSGVTQIAYQFNIPMVVTNVSGLPENVPDNKVGYVVAPEARAVSDAILRFFDEGKGTEFSANMKIEKKKYSWNVMVERIIQVANRSENH